MSKAIEALERRLDANDADRFQSDFQLWKDAQDIAYEAISLLRAGGWELQRYRYAVEFAAAESWDMTPETVHRLKWAKGLDGMELSADETATIASEFHAAPPLPQEELDADNDRPRDAIRGKWLDPLPQEETET